MEKAIELLRERGIAKAAKKSGRIAAEGLVECYVSEDGKVGAIVEVNAETDFVGKNQEYIFLLALLFQIFRIYEYSCFLQLLQFYLLKLFYSPSFLHLFFLLTL